MAHLFLHLGIVCAKRWDRFLMRGGPKSCWLHCTSGEGLVELITELHLLMGRSIIKSALLPPNLVRECLVSWGNQLGFRAEEKPSHKSKAGISFKFREMLEIAFLVERGRELSGRRSNG